MEIKENESLAARTTFAIGGVARYLGVAESVADLKAAFAFAKEKGVPTFVLGGGSNVLVSDQGFAGLVIVNKIRGIREIASSDAIVVESGAGESWDDLVSRTVNKGYWGLENLSAIPGTVGAAPVQNIGAYGREVMEVIESVTVFDPATGDERVLSNAECGFSYRESMFKHAGKSLVITKVSFRLSKVPSPNISYKDLSEYFVARRKAAPSLPEIRQAVITIRSSKFPDISKVGTAGSFWKNPIISADHFAKLKSSYPDMPSFPAGEGKVKIPLAWILDKACGLKGSSKGPVRLFEKQPLVVVAERGAKASDVRSMSKDVEDTVRRKTDIQIEEEVQALG